MNLSNQTVLLTGGAGTVGRHLVADLSPDVRRVVVLDRDEEALASLGRDLSQPLRGPQMAPAPAPLPENGFRTELWR